MQWFKFYGGEYLGDPKIMSLTPCERSCWITLLALACNEEDSGRIKFITEDLLMLQSGIGKSSDEWTETVGVIKKFQKLGMITDDNGMITLSNWQKRQGTALSGYERLKRFRAKKRLITPDNENDNNRVDKRRIDKNNTSAPRTKKVSVFNPLGGEVLKAFADFVDPKNKTYYSNTTQRSACDFLISEYGLEKVIQAIKILPQINQQKLYIKQIMTPFDLKENWVKIGNALKQKGDITSKKGFII